MIPLDRVARQLRRQSMEPHELAASFGAIARELIIRGDGEVADVVHEAAMKLREIAARRVAQARRKTA